MGRRILSGLAALLLALALLPAGAKAADTAKKDYEVETLTELKEYIERFKNGNAPKNYVYFYGNDVRVINEDVTFPEGLDFRDVYGKRISVTIMNGAKVTMEGTWAKFETATLQIQEGSSLKTSFLDCSGDLVVKGTLDVAGDIDCSQGLNVQDTGSVSFGQTLRLRDRQEPTNYTILEGSISFTNPESTLNRIYFNYYASTLESTNQFLTAAANDKGEHREYAVTLTPNTPLALAETLTIPANATLWINPAKNGAGAALEVPAGAVVSNAGGLYLECGMEVNGTLNNELGGGVYVRSNSSLTVNGTLNNKGSVGIAGSMTVNGALANDTGVNDGVHFAQISVARMNNDKGVLTLGESGTYSGYGHIGSSYPPSEDYKNFIIGFEKLGLKEYLHTFDDGTKSVQLNFEQGAQVITNYVKKISSAQMTDATAITAEGAGMSVTPVLEVTVDAEDAASGIVAATVAIYGKDGRMLGIQHPWQWLLFTTGQTTTCTLEPCTFANTPLSSVGSVQVFLLDDNNLPLSPVMRKTL